MIESTGTTTDDALARADQMRQRSLSDEVNSRRLAYKRATQALYEALENALQMMGAKADADPLQFRPPALSHLYRSVREAEATLVAAQMALSEFMGLPTMELRPLHND